MYRLNISPEVVASVLLKPEVHMYLFTLILQSEVFGEIWRDSQGQLDAGTHTHKSFYLFISEHPVSACCLNPFNRKQREIGISDVKKN